MNFSEDDKKEILSVIGILIIFVSCLAMIFFANTMGYAIAFVGSVVGCVLIHRGGHD